MMDRHLHYATFVVPNLCIISINNIILKKIYKNNLKILISITPLKIFFDKNLIGRKLL